MVVDGPDRGCFRCDGTGQICDTCGESEAVCDCEDEHTFSECEDCGGTGRADFGEGAAGEGD